MVFLKKMLQKKLTFGEKQIIKAYSMWAFGHVDMRTCGHAHMWRCRHVDMRTCGHADMSTCGHADMRTCAHAHMSTCRHVHMRTCRHAGMWTFPHVNMRTWRHSDMSTCGHGDMWTCGHVDPRSTPGRPRATRVGPDLVFFRGGDFKIDFETIINGRSMPWSFGCTKCRLERMKLKPF